MERRRVLTNQEWESYIAQSWTEENKIVSENGEEALDTLHFLANGEETAELGGKNLNLKYTLGLEETVDEKDGHANPGAHTYSVAALDGKNQLGEVVYSVLPHGLNVDGIKSENLDLTALLINKLEEHSAGIKSNFIEGNVYSNELKERLKKLGYEIGRDNATGRPTFYKELSQRESGGSQPGAE